MGFRVKLTKPNYIGILYKIAHKLLGLKEQ